MPALGGEFSSALDRVIQRALAKRPEDRWGSALELAAALRGAKYARAEEVSKRFLERVAKNLGGDFGKV